MEFEIDETVLITLKQYTIANGANPIEVEGVIERIENKPYHKVFHVRYFDRQINEETVGRFYSVRKKEKTQ